MPRLQWKIAALILLLSGCSESGVTPGLTPGEGFVDVEGGRVWYEIVGSGNETPLLLLHGGPGAPSDYLRPLAQVAVDRPVIFYDQLGAGRSAGPDDTALWTVERYVRELGQVREALGLDEVHILGHSWGSMLAMDYMLTGPEGVKSLVFASPALNLSRWTSDTRELLKQLPPETQATVQKHEAEGTTDDPAYQAAVMDFYARFLSRSDPWSPHLEAAFEGFNTHIYGYMWGPSEFTATGTLGDYDRESELETLDLPVLFTTGRYDEAVPETVRHYQSLVNNAELRIFEESAHMTMLDEADEYVAVIRDFLNRIDSKQAQ